MAIFTLLNIVIHHTGSTGAVPLGMYFSIVAVWFLVSIPLTFAGGYLATKAEILNDPVSTGCRGGPAGRAGGGCAAAGCWSECRQRQLLAMLAASCSAACPPCPHASRP